MEKLRTLQNNQTILENDKTIKFFSYNTLIATINKNKQNDNLQFTSKWDYSKTTTKYLYQFLNEYKCQIACNIYTKVVNALNDTNKKASFKNLIDSKYIKVVND